VRNPFRNEADAFRLLVIIGIAAAAVIVVALAAGSLAGALLGLVLVCVGGFYAWRWLRYALADREQPPR
jgi:hypothetical protein